MRKFILIPLLFSLCLSAMAQAYTPTSTWPYLYDQFREGTIYLTQGTTKVREVNVHCAHGKLHYIDNGIIREVVPTDIVMVEIGQDKYVAQYGSMYKVEVASDKGLVLSLSLGDFGALNETGGAYGTSSTSSATTKLSSFEVEGQVNQNHMLIWESKDDGVELKLKDTYYIKTTKDFVKATQKDLQNYFGDARKGEWKAWLKNHKVKWSSPESLAQIFDFFEQ